jgi:phosphoglycolate phosphatase
MNYQNILFDLDGTITDPCEGITNSYLHAVSKLNLIEDNPNCIREYIGAPLHSYFEIKHGIKNEDDLINGVALYREYYGVRGMFECRLYEGIYSLIQQLYTNNKSVFLVTSKPSFYAEKILHHFDLLKYFKDIFGSEMNAFNKSKEELIQNLLDNHNIEKELSVMIGDRKFDVIGAKFHGIDSIGVTYGYGSVEEIREAEPDYEAENVNKIVDILL